MKRYIKSSLNSDLHRIAVSSINGGDKSRLKGQLRDLLEEVPVGSYILVLGERGYNTGYIKISEDKFKWLYNGEIKAINSYWETSDSYIILPKSFKPSSRIDFDDDLVQVYEIENSNEEIYLGLEEDDPMKDEDWSFCADLSVYYFIDYYPNNMTYIKRKVER